MDAQKKKYDLSNGSYKTLVRESRMGNEGGSRRVYCGLIKLFEIPLQSQSVLSRDRT